MTASNRVELVFPSEFRHVDLVHSVCDRVSAVVGFDQDQTTNLGLAVREATINAIKHGNRMNARKKVSVLFQFDKRDVIVSVQDQGHGFDPSTMRDPTRPENIDRPNGRGFLLMRAFVDRIEVEPVRRGTVVRLIKRVPDAATRRGRRGRS